jgi:hypothetical protein
MGRNVFTWSHKCRNAGINHPSLYSNLGNGNTFTYLQIKEKEKEKEKGKKNVIGR